MIIDIRFASLPQFEAVTPTKNSVAISVLDEHESIKRPVLDGFADSLSLTFADAYESRSESIELLWPDEPSAEEHRKITHSPVERVPTLTDAMRIVRFVKQHQHSPEKRQLLIHCMGGISRSAAVAEWASLSIWLPITLGPFQSTACANPRLRRLLDKAADELRRAESAITCI